MTSTTGELKIGINGFGRIGRLVARVIFTNQVKAQIMAINDPCLSVAEMAYLLKYDSVFGRLVLPNGGEVKSDPVANTLHIGDQVIRCFAFKEVTKIPWAECGAEYIAETSGVYLTTEKASLHLQAGARKVVISAPTKDATTVVVMGVNHRIYNKDEHNIVSTASCTTNCLAPLMKVVDESFGIVEALMTTTHSITATQHTVDGSSSKEWRLGRAAGENIIPSTTGAAIAVTKVLPNLKGKFSGMSLRVPTIDVSVVDVVIKLATPIANIAELVDRVNVACSTGDLNGVLGVTYEPLVSTDFRGDSRSCILDSEACMMLNPTFVKLIAFYDNEWAYSVRLVEFMAYMRSCETA